MISELSLLILTERERERERERETKKSLFEDARAGRPCASVVRMLRFRL